ncbi:cellulose binding domain-containing protein [Saccharothrix xinjiangensis]|uniref:Cellulose binding domain-containing protein n=1 Tax=Saccharothrix xinjiangensis TaxID=204798 RepID=A0ABV9Y6E5_9PSEU
MRHRTLLGTVAVAAFLALATTGTALSGILPGAGTPVGAAAATAGCGKAPGLAGGTHTIQSGGKNRTFILRVPGNYDNSRPYRLIFAFHWWHGTANDVATGGSSGASWAYYGQQEQSNNSAILVAPQGIDNAWPNNGGEDVAFVDAMIARIEAALCVDTTQRFATGFSYGGGMSYALACGRANVFRAVAVFAGAQLSGCDGGTQPIAYLGIHGISDTVLNISQGRSLRDRFVRNNGCTATNPREPAAGSRTHITTAYPGCRAGYPVVWAAFDGGHLPGAVDGCACEDGARSWTKGEVWRFFSQFAGTPTDTTTTTTTTTTGTTGTTTTTTTPPGGESCRVSTTINAWNGGLTSSITITNTGAAPIRGWSLVFTLPGGQAITSGWNASYSPASGQVTARNASYNGEIAPNASVDIGFQANHTGNTGKPAAFTLNGAACAVA